MPEGDSVHRLAERLQPLEGRRVTAWDARIPALATTDLVGHRIQRVHAHGKHLFWDLAGDPDVVLHTHLRMEGTWRLHPAGARWGGPGHTARLVVRVEGSPDPAKEVELVGHDLGLVELWPAAEFARRTAHLGPDPLADDWQTPGRWHPTGRDEAVSRLAAASGTIGEAVMDQRILAGVGNEYRNELCFLLGLDPRSPVAAVDPARAVDLAAKVMQDNRHRLRTFTGIDRDGERTFVFGRNHRPCRRCGTPIRQATLGGAATVADPRAGQERIIWWCPSCQPLAPA